jgi:hypothetical protein
MSVVMEEYKFMRKVNGALTVMNDREEVIMITPHPA